MPPRPRALHLPSAPPKRRALVRKPHLSKLHLDSALLAQATDMPSSVPTPFHPPASPQIPARRQPAYSPGGFGLGSKPAPRANDIMGLGRSGKRVTLGSEEGSAQTRAAAAAEVERRDRVISEDEKRLENSRGESEAEACYIVSLLTPLY